MPACLERERLSGVSPKVFRIFVHLCPIRDAGHLRPSSYQMCALALKPPKRHSRKVTFNTFQKSVKMKKLSLTHRLKRVIITNHNI